MSPGPFPAILITMTLAAVQVHSLGEKGRGQEGVPAVGTVHGELLSPVLLTS